MRPFTIDVASAPVGGTGVLGRLIENCHRPNHSVTSPTPVGLRRAVEGDNRHQISLLPPCIDDYVAQDALVRVVDAFFASLDLAELGFNRVVAAATRRPRVPAW